MFHALNVSTTGLVAQRHRMDTIAGNIANLNTTRDAEGNLSPFQRQIVVFQAQNDEPAEGGAGVKFEVLTDPEARVRKVADPEHPDAVDGFVSYPDISLNTEFVNALEASRAYEANIAAIDATKAMISQALRILA
jgi:flagellar basal-body rod protein FlgC